MIKHLATVVGVGVAVAFVAVFFTGRTTSKALTEVAPKVGMSSEELLAVGPRVASSTGATLGSSRRVVYLLACSGQATKATLEPRATEATRLAQDQRLSDREAVTAVLTQHATVDAEQSLEGC